MNGPTEIPTASRDMVSAGVAAWERLAKAANGDIGVLVREVFTAMMEAAPKYVWIEAESIHYQLREGVTDDPEWVGNDPARTTRILRRSFPKGRIIKYLDHQPRPDYYPDMGSKEFFAELDQWVAAERARRPTNPRKKVAA